MRLARLSLISLFFVPFLFSCNKTLNVNANWKDITVVYGILDQGEDTTFIKITKAFLGDGDALVFSKIPDSSNYPNKLEVRLDEYEGTVFQKSYPCDTVTIHNKKAGDSIFYYPDQLMYFTTAKLNDAKNYKLYIRNKETGKEITSTTDLKGINTPLVKKFSIEKPMVSASFPIGKNFEVKWYPAENGKRYQLVIRFLYYEALKLHPQDLKLHYIDWLVFNNIKSTDGQTLPFDLYYPGDAFYSIVGSQIPVNSDVTRSAYRAIFIFTVAGADLNTYMDVHEPSLSLVQEKPTFSNIVNGIGLFSARYKNSTDSLLISPVTQNELKVNSHTKDLGF
ncbi:MAG: hypothetical protein PHF97_00265 [Bacteroidales bacterium]|nr:hypothetical protein [Bacteroidales bacterium]